MFRSLAQRQVRRGWLIVIPVLVALCAGTLTLSSSAQAGRATSVTPERFARLAKGVNFSFWFWYAPEGNVDPAYITDGELQMLADAGLTHVRLPFDPDSLMPDPANPTSLDPTYLAAMDAAVARINAVGLAVIIDPHPYGVDLSTFRQQIALSDTYLTETALPFYQAYAAHFSAISPELLFFETMNEPVMHEFFAGSFEEQVTQGIARWNVVQPQIAAALRAGAPQHTIIAKGETWDSIDSLLEVELLPDTNVIYNFHFYDPFAFTHQGATWTWYCVQGYSGVPYPSSPAGVAPLLPAVPEGECRDSLWWYGEERWDRAKVEASIQRAADWGAANGVYLTVNEFGVFTPNTPAVDRLSLIRDMRLSFDTFGIGWTMWDFDGGFDLVDGDDGSRYIAVQMAEALGLSVDGAISLTQPEANGVYAASTLPFAWAANPVATKYVLKIRDRGYDAPDYAFRQKFNTPGSICAGGACSAALDFSGKPLPKLKTGALLEWQITTKGAGEYVRKSTWQYFRVEMPPIADLLAPADEATVPADPTLSWTYVAEAASYKLVVRDTWEGSAIPTPVKFKLTNTSTPSIAEVCDTLAGTCTVLASQVGQTLQPGAYFKWNVTTISADGKSKSPSWNFLVEAGAAVPLPDAAPESAPGGRS